MRGIIACFPDPYPDELFFSIGARYRHDRVAYKSDRVFYHELFGKQKGSISVNFPTDLNSFTQNLSSNYNLTPNDIIDRHTIFPLFSPFLAKEVATHCRQIMTNRHREKIGRKFPPLLFPTTTQQHLRYCNKCVQEDRKAFGETYWHRVHQYSSVLVCPIHEITLSSSSILVQARLHDQQLVTAEMVIPRTLPRTSQSFHSKLVEMLLLLSQDTQWLLNNPVISNNEFVLDQYRILLAERGLGRYFGEFDQRRIKKHLLNYYPKPMLDILNCSLSVTNQDSWNILMLQRGKLSISTVNPVWHLLFIRSFERSVQRFFEYPSVYMPFGQGPWKCLNPFCPYYNQECIESVAIKRNSAYEPLGLFRCTCGFSYSRVGPDTKASDKQRIGRIEEYGPVWEEGFRSGWNETNSDRRNAIVSLANKTGASLHGVMYQARRLGLL